MGMFGFENKITSKEYVKDEAFKFLTEFGKATHK